MLIELNSALAETDCWKKRLSFPLALSSRGHSCFYSYKQRRVVFYSWFYENLCSVRRNQLHDFLHLCVCMHNLYFSCLSVYSNSLSVFIFFTFVQHAYNLWPVLLCSCVSGPGSVTVGLLSWASTWQSTQSPTSSSSSTKPRYRINNTMSAQRCN